MTPLVQWECLDSTGDPLFKPHKFFVRVKWVHPSVSWQAAQQSPMSLIPFFFERVLPAKQVFS
jgi:hypothetical protein